MVFPFARSVATPGWGAGAALQKAGYPTINIFINLFILFYCHVSSPNVNRRQAMYRKLTQTAVLAAICFLLTLTGLGFIATPFLKITFVHLPVIFGTLYIGKKEGILLGLIFGLCSLYANITSPGAISFVFYNPLVSIFPRVMIPLVVIGASNLIKHTKKEINVLISALLGSLTNTVLVLGMIYVLYAAQYANALSLPPGAVAGALALTAVTQGLAEAAFVSILTLALMRVLKADIATITATKTKEKTS